MRKLEIIRKLATSPCYCCNKSIKGKTIPRKNCKICNGTGIYVENFYYHIIIGKDGKKYCIEGDTIK
jgi:hypothetical protein